MLKVSRKAWLGFVGPGAVRHAQSSAAIVAIAGGFLLAALWRRRASGRPSLLLREARERLALLEGAYKSAYEYRLQNSNSKSMTS